MSAAPLLSNSRRQFDEVLSKRAKKGVLDPISCFGRNLNLTCGANSVTLSPQLASLRLQFPSHGIPFLGSILEASGGKLDAAHAVLNQILRAKTNTRPDALGKRRRSCDIDSDDGFEEQPPVEPASCDQLLTRVNVVTNEMVRRLQGVSTADEACVALRPGVEALMIENADGASKTDRQERLHKLLTRTIISQADCVSNLRVQAASHNEERELMRRRLVEMEASLHEISISNKKLRETNATLSFYIAAAVGSGGAGFGRDEDHDFGNNSRFENHHPGPGVF